jgi:hypothetical protein
MGIFGTYKYKCIHLEDASTVPYKPFNKPTVESDAYK